MRSHQPRRGFTLVELLVVMALIAMLAALMVAFLPNAASAQREARAATVVQSALNIAKQRALRDQRNVGVRFWITSTVVNGTTINNVVTDMQYIEQPDDFPSVQTSSARSGPPPTATPFALQSPAWIYGPTNTIGFFDAGGAAVDLTNGNTTGGMLQLNPLPPVPPPGTTPVGYIVNPAPPWQPMPNGAAGVIDPNMKYWTVQPDDYFEVLGNGLMHRIVQIGVPNGDNSPSGAMTSTNNNNYIVITPPLGTPLTAATTNWRIVRAPRAVGDETLKMPDSTLIDLNTNFAYAVTNPLPPNDPTTGGIGYIDILFSPSGEVISRGVSTDKVNLWVRSPSLDFPTDPFRGDPTIVSVFVRTGFVGAFKPDQSAVTGGNPYTFVK